jgi:hypothetical protein
MARQARRDERESFLRSFERLPIAARGPLAKRAREGTYDERAAKGY